MPKTVREKREQEVRVLLTPSLKARAQARAEAERTSMSSLTMRALEAYLERTEPNPLMQLAGAWAEDGQSIAADIRAARRNKRHMGEW
jgi:hypothetical protein